VWRERERERERKRERVETIEPDWIRRPTGEKEGERKGEKKKKKKEKKKGKKEKRKKKNSTGRWHQRDRKTQCTGSKPRAT
jgi:hypothetical protein